MFQGSLPDSVLRIVGDCVKGWSCTDIFVGCSGNFTVERMLKKTTDFRLHGNDVTIYSCILGNFFAGNPIKAEFREDYTGPMAFVKDYMKSDLDIAAVTLMLSKLAVYLASKPNPFYLRMIDAHKAQWPTLFSQTRDKLEKAGQFLTSFYAGDVIEWIDAIPKEQGFISYPPFYAGGYEKMHKAISEIIAWNPPEYEILDRARMMDMLRKVAERKYFIFTTTDELPEFSEYLVGISQTTSRGVPLYVYSKATKSRIMVPNQQVSSPMVERLGEDEDIGDEIKLVPLKSEHFRALRSQYLNPHIKPGSETSSYGVFVDNKLVGVFAFSASPTLSNWDKHIQTPTMYLLSDFPVAPTKYKRLAKLVLYASLSKESKMLAERLTSHRIRSLVTTAFSKKPVSMKYRGLFQLLSKKEIEEVDGTETDMSKCYYSKGYQLNYGAEMGQWTLAEGLALWKKNHAQTDTEGDKA